MTHPRGRLNCLCTEPSQGDYQKEIRIHFGKFLNEFPGSYLIRYGIGDNKIRPKSIESSDDSVKLASNEISVKFPDRQSGYDRSVFHLGNKWWTGNV
jgi:hypothetical protein